jgi:hypothetical protein
MFLQFLVSNQNVIVQCAVSVCIEISQCYPAGTQEHGMTDNGLRLLREMAGMESVYQIQDLGGIRRHRCGAVSKRGDVQHNAPRLPRAMIGGRVIIGPRTTGV